MSLLDLESGLGVEKTRIRIWIQIRQSRKTRNRILIQHLKKKTASDLLEIIRSGSDKLDFRDILDPGV